MKLCLIFPYCPSSPRFISKFFFCRWLRSVTFKSHITLLLQSFFCIIGKDNFVLFGFFFLPSQTALCFMFQGSLLASKEAGLRQYCFWLCGRLVSGPSLGLCLVWVSDEPEEGLGRGEEVTLRRPCLTGFAIAFLRGNPQARGMLVLMSLLVCEGSKAGRKLWAEAYSGKHPAGWVSESAFLKLSKSGLPENQKSKTMHDTDVGRRNVQSNPTTISATVRLLWLLCFMSIFIDILISIKNLCKMYVL